MSSSIDSSNNVVNIESSEVTRTASGSAGETSNSDHLVVRKVRVMNGSIHVF